MSIERNIGSVVVRSDLGGDFDTIDLGPANKIILDRRETYRLGDLVRAVLFVAQRRGLDATTLLDMEAFAQEQRARKQVAG